MYILCPPIGNPKRVLVITSSSDKKRLLKPSRHYLSESDFICRYCRFVFAVKCTFDSIRFKIITTTALFNLTRAFGLYIGALLQCKYSISINLLTF